MQLFYVPDITGELCSLSPEESRHCVKVLRMNEGDEINIIDGVGGFYKATIIDADHKSCKVHLGEKEQGHGQKEYYLHVAIAPTKNIDRFEWFLEKATEIGIDEITPLLCEHSERKVIKSERLNKILVSAAKQSIKAYIPKLNPLTSFEEFINISFEGSACIAHCEEDKKELLKNKIQLKGRNLIAIGPEGDFSEEEIKKAIDSGFYPISLGNSRLRTETAGVVAVHTLELLHQ